MFDILRDVTSVSKLSTVFLFLLFGQFPFVVFLYRSQLESSHRYCTSLQLKYNVLNLYLKLVLVQCKLLQNSHVRNDWDNLARST